MPHARSEIRQLFDDVTRAFSALDLGAYRRLFVLPCLLVGERGVHVLADDGAFAALFVPLLDGLRAQGYTRSAVLHQHIAVLGATTALASVLWARYRADDEELERLGATYTLCRGEDGWRIAAIVAHAPERVLAIDQD